MVGDAFADALDRPLPMPTREHGMAPSALWMAALGFRVFPLRFGAKTPHPMLGRGWRVEAVGSCDVALTEARWAEDPWAGIAVVPPVVLDLDRKHGGRPALALAKRCAELGVELPRGAVVRTPRGEHRWCALPAGARLQRVHGYLVDVDVQAGGSYVVAPPTHVRPALYDGGLRSHSDPAPSRNRKVRDDRPWPGYLWSRPEVPLVEDAGPFGGTVDQLTPEETWWPTGAELLDALSAAVLPPEFVADVAATPDRPTTSGGHSAAGGGVPVAEWEAHGITPGLDHQPSLWLAACSLTGSGRDAEETFTVLRRIADATPLKNPHWPWSDADLQDLADRAHAGLAERRKRDLAESTALGRMITWEPPS